MTNWLLELNDSIRISALKKTELIIDFMNNWLFDLKDHSH